MFKRLTFNRTILELKPEVFAKSDIGLLSFNRTILELKLIKKKNSRHEKGLSIVPYWNWNSSVIDICASVNSFQSYHTGIETKHDGYLLDNFMAFNRTILELKQGTFNLNIGGYQAFNRTILELKHRYNLINIKGISLSIVPYWNWNSRSRPPPDSSLLFQSYHTGIETMLLQLEPFLRRCLSIVPYWNWNVITKFELEINRNFQSYHTGIETHTILCHSVTSGTFNRTILELKPEIQSRYLILLSLSIVPYWNWNGVVMIEKRRAWCFQSYHTGIETSRTKSTGRMAGLSIVPYWNWNADIQWISWRLY